MKLIYLLQETNDSEIPYATTAPREAFSPGSAGLIQYFATVRHENLEQVIFGGRQLDLLPIELHNPRGEVHLEWTCAKLLLRRQWIQSIH